MKEQLFKLYAYLFSHPSLISFNRALYYFSLRGLGVLNYYNDTISGEKLVQKKLKNKNIIVIFDIGANLGNYIKMVDSIYKSVTIYAFEPHPKTYNSLKKIHCNSTVIFENIAISDSNTTIQFYDHADGSEHGSIYKEQMDQIGPENVKSFNVVSKTLDSYCNEKSIQTIDFMKIDVEGAEYKVLQGAKVLLSEKRIRYIQFEFNSTHVASHVFFKDFLNLLSGYTLYRILTHGLLPLNYNNPELVEIFAFQNILAVLDGEKID